MRSHLRSLLALKHPYIAAGVAIVLGALLGYLVSTLDANQIVLILIGGIVLLGALALGLLLVEEAREK